jgi:exodeoxyribonuclease VII small subunit
VTGQKTDSEHDVEVGYAAAVAELNEILGDLEDDSLDIDVLAARVERAAHLIAVCRERIGVAKLQVNEIVAAIETDDNAPMNGQ